MKMLMWLCFVTLYRLINAIDYVWLSPCVTDKDCEELEAARCVNGTCTCEDRLDVACRGMAGVVLKVVRKSCATNADCNVENSECRHRLCVCRENFAASATGRQCLSAAALGAPCQDSVQCSPSMGACIGGRCTCRPDRHEHNGTCHRNVGLDEPCGGDEECVAPLSQCAAGKCACTDGFVGAMGRCLPQAGGLGAECVESVQCIATLGHGAECAANTCDCRELYQYKNKTKKCVRDVLLGENCAEHLDCHQPGHQISRLECALGVCKCRSTYIEENNYCINSSAVFEPNNIFTLLFISVLFIFCNY